MSSMIFVNLPVADLDRSKTFFAALDYSYAEQFTDEKRGRPRHQRRPHLRDAAAEGALRDATFTRKQIVDAATRAEVLLVFGVESREKVNELADKALAARRLAGEEPTDLGFRCRHSFQDPDGHRWEALYMVVAAAGAAGSVTR